MKKQAEEYAQKRQLERFLETARELGCDESGETFERAFGQIVPAKRPKPKREPEKKNEVEKP